MLQFSRLVEYLRYFDPALSAGKESDLYEEVARRFISSEGRSKDALQESLIETYGESWLLNSELKEEAFLQLLLARDSDASTEEELSSIDGTTVWRDNEKCKFIGWQTKNILEGTTWYTKRGDSQSLQFKFAGKNKTRIDFIHLGADLAIGINEYGRVCTPGHNLDNLFLENREHTSITPPESVPGRVYLLAPQPETWVRARYIQFDNLENLKIDKEKKLLVFGSEMGDINLEVATGFVLSLRENKLVNAWVQLENLK